MQKIIYADHCNPLVSDKIKSELNLEVVRRLPNESWTIQESTRLITDPSIVLAVISTLDEISLLEIGILLFLCKPVLIADKVVEEYELLGKQVDFIDPGCNLKEVNNTFTSWFNYTERL